MLDFSNTVAFVDSVLRHAIARQASDVHFEPFEKSLQVRLRLDGLLHPLDLRQGLMTEQIVSRLKVMGSLDIAEKRKPQDGRISYAHAVRMVDMRISTLPTLWGEKVVLRILDNRALELDFAAMGMTATQMTIMQDALLKPHGMILVTGPTGSGKTATLYACLRQLNQPTRNVCTVEDPVEIFLEGVNQVHVNIKAGLTFSSSMRAFLRQDPDVMMVGEIRDEETADIATKAAQTGHMVLSTLHTNDAPSTIERLRHMGVADWHLASCIHLVVAQRLLRRLCPQCRQPQALKIEGEGTLFQANPQGCAICFQGYRGRVAVFQMLQMQADIRERIHQGCSSQELARWAQQQGMQTLYEAAAEQARAGVTSWSEVLVHTDTPPP